MDKVIERLNDLNLCYLEDPNQHIQKYSYSCKKKLETSKIANRNSECSSREKFANAATAGDRESKILKTKI